MSLIGYFNFSKHTLIDSQARSIMQSTYKIFYHIQRNIHTNTPELVTYHIIIQVLLVLSYIDTDKVIWHLRRITDVP